MAKNSRGKTEEEKRFAVIFVKQLVTLSTAGFGLVAALAWNNLIQEFVNTYVKRWFPSDGKLISLLLYALIITTIAVLVTYQLSKIAEKIEKKNPDLPGPL